ncbi:HsdR family type I site-specific deoxyribonuclease [Paenibacillus polymyxa]|jgi:type I restriction enzyme R subunit|uniref:type I restriction endonuclease subunit R n=1 Tax=Paenibacillus TaxID=44249 RepID=UPI000D308CB6|nr:MULTISPECIES: HsdR family type I site-specific deoxyribonuclease [Paenibacillus]KAF6616171.1 HsdR family type I site-specific deoxyribonuclease [Paenibacillus sp. EKM101P]KAF6618005.1 HsdR family type I site-specific deoxyribonuclease [Paenibacillus sp. EKM102P]KAF6626069.1 HsdR family type I site-specific deoxyribonuclease [Paenibacillus sp. EKM10P]KAF6642578.1 HsdR family type I site-specific deoxyribonuclease [Paenibacillus sp. EKM11P]MBY0020911.1 HsdR family type I site-specific deoxyri
MFNEDNTIEQLVITTLKSNGWKYVSSEELQREYSDVMVETMVKEALIRLNPEIAEEPSRADEVIYKLRTLILTVQPHNLVTQNEMFKKMVFEENSYPFGKDGRMIPIRFFGTMTKEDQVLNEYVVTNQWVYPQKENGKRLDIVLLINGFPVAIGELKTPVRNSITWLDAAGDIAAYERSIPGMFVTNIFNFATEGKCYRYGSVCMPVGMWGPWHTPDHKSEGSLADVKISVEDMITPEKIMDIFQFFTLFATDKKYRKYKVICRYQQYEGANLIVERVKAGYPKQGLIWHFQGSGKSLLMVFAAQKLRMMPELNNPTIVIVDDRIDLETQITATFNASDIPNLVSLGSKDELESFFLGDQRKIAITTIFKFGDVKKELNPRDNIILMVDEAHRTQEGDLGSKMRLALPNAFFFGLTGTPINRIDKNTFNTFGAVEDKSGYMSKYSFSDSIRDNATLPLNFEPVPVDLHVDREKLDAEFEALTENLSNEDKAELSRRVNMKAIMYDRKRIRKICEHIAKHYREKIEPNGYKGQVVCYDRACCLMYKEELDKLLGPEATTIVMDTNNDKEDKYKAYKRDRDAEGKVLDRFREPNDPLKLVIVTSKLLTGFDAPILQAMYLDKPMKDHNLLQAICRTNRTYNEGKTHGLIVDYIGIFDNVATALDFDESSMKKVISNIEEVKKQIPALVRKCLSYFMGVDRTIDGWEGLIAAQECLPNNKIKDEFGADYKVLNRAWDALSPDPFLNSMKFDYQWLTRVFESVKPTDGRGGLIWASLGAKTLELVHENLQVGEVHDDMEILTMDADLIDEFIERQKDLRKTTIKVEIDLVARIRKHSNDIKFVKLGEKLENIREKHEQGLITSIEFLKLLLELAREAAEAEQEVVPEEEVDKGKAALTELFDGLRNSKTPIIVERIVGDIDDIVKIVRFDGWQGTTAGKQEVKKALRSVVWVKYKIKDKEVFDKAYQYIEQYY